MVTTRRVRTTVPSRQVQGELGPNSWAGWPAEVLPQGVNSLLVAVLRDMALFAVDALGPNH